MRWVWPAWILVLLGVSAAWPLLWAALAGASFGFQAPGLTGLLKGCFRALRSGELTVLLTLMTLLVPSLGVGARLGWCLVARLRRTRRLLRRLLSSEVPPPPGISRLAQRSGAHKQIVYVADSDLYAFAYGLWRPRIAISSGLGGALSEAELLAVMRHEVYHARRGGIWRHLLLCVVRDAVGFLPLLRSLTDAGQLSEELAADRYACGSNPEALLSALLKLARHPPTPLPLPGAGGWLGPRVRALCGEAQPVRLHSPRQWFGLILVVALLSFPLIGHAANWLGLEWHRGSGPHHEGTTTC